jgi:hypothetical protein
MLLINDVKVTALDKDDKFVEHYEYLRRETKRQFKDTVTFDFPKDKYKKIPNPQNMGARLESPQGTLMKTNYMYVAANASYDVRWYNQEKKTKSGIKYEPAFIHFGGRMVLNLKKDWDKIFFMLFVSPVVGKLFDPELARYQNIQKGGNVHYVLVDEDAEATIDVSKARMRAEVEALITSPVYGLSDEKIVDVAIGYGLVNPMKKVKPDTARHLLLKYVFSGDKENLIFNRMQEFKASAGLEDRIAVRRLVREAIELNVVGFRKLEGTKTRVWAVLDPSGEPREDLVKTNWAQTYENTLEDWLINNPVKLDEISEYVRQNKDAHFTKVEVEAASSDDPFGYEDDIPKPKRTRNTKASTTTKK